MKKIVIGLVLFYLRTLAKIQLKKFNPVVIGVGGASGKTSLTRIIYLILKEKYKVRQGMGKNSETGIPLNILNINIDSYSVFSWFKVLIVAPLKVLFDWRNFDVYIAEMGIDGPSEPKNMSYLLKIIKPQISVLTNISFEHSQYFEPLVKNQDPKSKQTEILNLTANQESLLITSLLKDDTAIVNGDDENIKKYLSEVNAELITISLKNRKSDFYIERIDQELDRFTVNYVHNGKKYKINLDHPLPNHFAYSFMYALAVSAKLGIEEENAIRFLEKNFSLPPGRMSIFKGKNNSIIIDSSYNNATLTPILDILDFLQKIEVKRRKVAIIGDMRELGSMSKDQHEQVAEKILQTADFAILIGPLTNQFIAPVLEKNKFKFLSFPNFTTAKSEILNRIEKNDLVLVKGSQNTLYLERVVEMLLENSSDKDKLCRRGSFWDKKRQESL